MLKLLISITSFRPQAELVTVITNYQKDFADCELHFVIAAPYPLPVSGTPIELLPTNLTGPLHAWSNHAFIHAHYHAYDYIINSDADILVPRSTFDNYRKHAALLTLDQIPGVLSCETQEVGGMSELFVLTSHKCLPVFSSKTNGYFTPFYKHAACSIVDPARYANALSKGYSVTPFANPGYHIQETARTQLYLVLQECIHIEDLEHSLVYHLPNRYVLDPLHKPFIRSYQELVNGLTK